MPTPELVSLHRYYIWANRMRTLFYAELKQQDLNALDPVLVLAGDIGLLSSYWYGALYVVVEGYKELKLSDPAIDLLLQSDNVELLRRYRNGTFHFQRNYFDDRFNNFFAERSTVEWVRTLNREFGRFFLEAHGFYQQESGTGP